MITLKEIQDNSDWQIGVVTHSVPLMQTFSYGEVQKKSGRNVVRFQILESGQIIGYVQFIVYPLFGDKVYWYSPYGPVLKSYSEDIFRSLKSELQRLVKGSSVVFVRLDFTPVMSSEMYMSAKKNFVVPPESSYIGAYFQPRHEWYTDIHKTPDEILLGMHHKTRYSVRLAEKKGVTTKVVNNNLESRFNDFMTLMKGTAERNHFTLHKDDYYKDYFREVEKVGNAFIVEAWVDDSLLASHFMVVEGEVVHYLFGASSNEKRDLCAPFLAHFNAMKEGRARGGNFYNFGAISLDGENDHWKSLTAFKQRFGGDVVSHNPFLDLVQNSFWYYIYIARKFIKKYI